MKLREPVILHVDDDSNDQFLVRAAFEHIGVKCPVLGVGDGDEVVCYLKGLRQYTDRVQFPYPTMLLIDLKMPKINGFELLAFLKQNPNLMVIPTVVFTSSVDTNDITNSFLLGANAYHVKPHSLPEMKTQLKLLHDYWASCQVPEVDASGNLVETESSGKLSEKVLKPVRNAS